MKGPFFLLILALCFVKSYGQSPMKEIVVDTTLGIVSIQFKHNQDTVNKFMYPGRYRITFDNKVKVDNEIDLQLLGRKSKSAQRFNIKKDKSATHIDFQVLHEELEVTFIANNSQSITYPLQANISYVYTAHTKEDIPEFTLTDLEGNTYTNQTLLGKVVILNIWGIACTPCVREIPQLNSLVKRYEASQDVVFIAISPDQIDRLKTFLTRTIFNYKVVGKSQKLMNSFVTNSLLALPLHMIIDKEGKLIYKHLGTHEQIEDILSLNIDKHL